MKREILVVALLFLSISSCKKAENPVNPSWELSGKIVYTTWDYESVKNSIYVEPVAKPGRFWLLNSPWRLDSRRI